MRCARSSTPCAASCAWEAPGACCERIAEQAREVPATRHVCVGDRESDILALLLKARDMDHAAGYLRRCQHSMTKNVLFPSAIFPGSGRSPSSSCRTSSGRATIIRIGHNST